MRSQPGQGSARSCQTQEAIEKRRGHLQVEGRAKEIKRQLCFEYVYTRAYFIAPRTSSTATTGPVCRRLVRQPRTRWRCRCRPCPHRDQSRRSTIESQTVVCPATSHAQRPETLSSATALCSGMPVSAQHTADTGTQRALEGSGAQRIHPAVLDDAPRTTRVGPIAVKQKRRPLCTLSDKLATHASSPHREKASLANGNRLYMLSQWVVVVHLQRRAARRRMMMARPSQRQFVPARDAVETAVFFASIGQRQEALGKPKTSKFEIGFVSPAARATIVGRNRAASVHWPLTRLRHDRSQDCSPNAASRSEFSSLCERRRFRR